jgi:hypothetical protein
MIAKTEKTTDTYIDAQGNKVVEPVFNGSGGSVGSRVSVKK